MEDPWHGPQRSMYSPCKTMSETSGNEDKGLLFSGPKSSFLLEIKVLVWRYTESKLPEVHCKASTGTAQKMRISW